MRCSFFDLGQRSGCLRPQCALVLASEAVALENALGAELLSHDGVVSLRDKPNWKPPDERSKSHHHHHYASLNRLPPLL